MNYSLKRYPSFAMIKKRIQYYDKKRKNFLLYLLFYLLSVIRMICSLDILYHFFICFYIFLPFQSALTLIIIFPQSCFLSVLLCRWNNGINPIFASDTFDCFIHLLIDTSTKCPIIFWLYETLRLSQKIILSTFRIWFSPTVDIIFSYYRFRSVALNLPNKKNSKPPNDV